MCVSVNQECLGGGGLSVATHMHFVVLVNVSNVLNDIRIRHMLIGLLTRECQYLPQGDGKGPNVRLGAEFGLQLGVCVCVCYFSCTWSFKTTLCLFNIHNHSPFYFDSPCNCFPCKFPTSLIHICCLPSSISCAFCYCCAQRQCQNSKSSLYNVV